MVPPTGAPTNDQQISNLDFKDVPTLGDFSFLIDSGAVQIDNLEIHELEPRAPIKIVTSSWRMKMEWLTKAIGLAILAITTMPHAHAASKPNIVLFLVDDMGWMDTSAYGSQYYETPNMDRLKKQTMLFTDAYAVPLCSPSRASILTGQYSARHGITSASGHRPSAPEGKSRYAPRGAPNKQFIYADSKTFLDLDYPTLGEVLLEAGYRTGHFGKWHLGLTAAHRPDQHGFETTWQCAPDPGPPSYFSPYGVFPDGNPTGNHKVGNITDGPIGEYITDRLTDEALQFMTDHRDEPFFLNLWQYGVHGPWGHKEQYTAAFAKKTDPRGVQSNAIMASMLKSVDDSLGRVMDKLDELNLTQNTLFIFFSDNGGNTHSNVQTDPAESIDQLTPTMQDWRKWAGPVGPTNNAPLREGKGRIYEGGQRVPLMVRWPGKVQPGSTSDAIVSVIDIYPTILDALNIAPPKGHIIDGQSFVPVLTQTDPFNRDTYFAWFPHLIPAASVRKGDWKLIRRFEPHPLYPETLGLYNLKDDIGESNNRASAMPKKVKQLNALIDDFVNDTGALYPKANPAWNPRSVAPQRNARGPSTGLVPKMCTATVVDGALRVEADGPQPFLGTAQIKYNAPMTVHLKVRSPKGGQGKVAWKTAGQDDFNKTQSTAFTLTASSDWQEVTVNLPIKAKTQLIRLYLPVEDAPVEIKSIEYRASQSNKLLHKWAF